MLDSVSESEVSQPAPPEGDVADYPSFKRMFPFLFATDASGQLSGYSLSMVAQAIDREIDESKRRFSPQDRDAHHQKVIRDIGEKVRSRHAMMMVLPNSQFSCVIYDHEWFAQFDPGTDVIPDLSCMDEKTKEWAIESQGDPVYYLYRMIN